MLCFYGAMPYESQSISEVYILLKDKGQSSGSWEGTPVEEDKGNVIAWYGREMEKWFGERGKL